MRNFEKNIGNSRIEIKNSHIEILIFFLYVIAFTIHMPITADSEKRYFIYIHNETK